MEKGAQLKKELQGLFDMSFYSGEMLIVGLSKAILREILEEFITDKGKRDSVLDMYRYRIDQFIEDSKKGETNGRIAKNSREKS